jgi:hypothetical protein
MRTFFLSFLAAGLLGLAACDCDENKCTWQQIDVTVADTFGNNLYDLDYEWDSLQVFAVTQTGVVEPFPTPSRAELGVARIPIDIDPRLRGYIFRHNAAESDTIELLTDANDTRCCGNVPELRAVIFRGREVSVSALNRLVLRK